MQYAWNAFLSPWWLTEGVRVPPELNASTFPLPHAGLQCFVQFINHIIAERRLKTTGRSGVGVRRRRRRVSIYIKYTCRRLETYNYHLNACLQIQFKRLLKVNALHVKKTKCCRGANPRRRRRISVCRSYSPERRQETAGR